MPVKVYRDSGQRSLGVAFLPDQRQVHFNWVGHFVGCEITRPERGEIGHRTRTAILSLLDARKARGASSSAAPPRIVMSAPPATARLVDPSSLLIRWDTVPIATSGDETAPERPERLGSPDAGEPAATSSKLCYTVLYSPDHGRSWNFAADGSAARLGRRPPTHLCLEDAAAGPEELVIATPAQRFPAGSYLIRVEAFWREHAVHGSYHMRRVEILR